MAGNGGMTPSEVKSAVNAVDCSVSDMANQDSGGKASVNVGGGEGSGFNAGGVPGYGSGKAKKAPQA